MDRMIWVCYNCGRKENKEYAVLSYRCPRCFKPMECKVVTERIKKIHKEAGIL